MTSSPAVKPAPATTTAQPVAERPAGIPSVVCWLPNSSQPDNKNEMTISPRPNQGRSFPIMSVVFQRLPASVQRERTETPLISALRPS
jgi:hypothetical protein